MKTTRPRISVAITASPMLTSVVSSHSRCSAIAAAARRCSVTSWNTITTPSFVFWSSTIGAALVAIGRSLRSRAISRVWW
jgi:hypothetical protein